MRKLKQKVESESEKIETEVDQEIEVQNRDIVDERVERGSRIRKYKKEVEQGNGVKK